MTPAKLVSDLRSFIFCVFAYCILYFCSGLGDRSKSGVRQIRAQRAANDRSIHDDGSPRDGGPPHHCDGPPPLHHYGVHRWPCDGGPGLLLVHFLFCTSLILTDKLARLRWTSSSSPSSSRPGPLMVAANVANRPRSGLVQWSIQHQDCG